MRPADLTRNVAARMVLCVSISCAMIATAGGRAAAEEYQSLETRPDVSVQFVVTAPDNTPVAAAILFPGGSGKLKLRRDSGPRSNNFLVRSRSLFAARGVIAVTLDVPSDRKDEGLRDFRGTDEHRADVAAVLAWARARWNVPVWLVGTSRGTVSLGHIAGKLPIDGAVFSSSVVKKSRRNPPMALDGDLEAIKVPVLVVHHRDDECVVTPPDRLDRLTRRLTGAAKVETLLFDGGKPAESEPCQAKSAHGFFGIEEKVVDAIVDWMRANTMRR